MMCKIVLFFEWKKQVFDAFLDPKMSLQITKMWPKIFPIIEGSLFFLHFSRFRGATYFFDEFGRFWAAFLDHLGGSGEHFWMILVDWEGFGGRKRVNSNFEIGATKTSK
jgi:hypothetical protein